MDWLQEILANNQVAIIITVSTLMMTLFARTIIGVFRLGVTFKTQLATKEELHAFEEEIRRDLRSYKEELSTVIMTTAIQIINDKLKDVDSMHKTLADMKAIKAVLEVEMKNAMEKIDEVHSLADTVRILSAKVQRMEYNKESLDIKRVDKN